MDREEAINVVKRNWPEGRHQLSEALKTLIPEFQESEDEKIRNRIIGYLKLDIEEHPEREERINEMLAYLERQEEYIEDIRQYAYNKGLVDAEQKPAEWSEEDEEHINSILERLEGMCKKGATFTPTRFAVSEDEDWLKSLRHQPKQKSHLGKKDQWCYNAACAAVRDSDAYSGEVKQFILGILQRCEAQLQWKPSEEQMTVLAKAIELRELTEKDGTILMALRTDLKNL